MKTRISRLVLNLPDFLLLLVAFTSVFATYHGLHHINNALIVLFICVSFLRINRHIDSRLSVGLILLAVFGCIAQLYLTVSFSDEVDSRFWTLIIIAFLAYFTAKSGQLITFEKLVVTNILLLPLLFYLGGLNLYQGRILTDWVTPNMQGLLAFFGYMVCGRYLLEGNKRLFNGALFGFCALFLVLSGSRQNFLFMAVGSFFLVLPILLTKNLFKKHNLLKKQMIVLVFIVIVGVVFGRAVEALKTRFNAETFPELVAAMSLKNSEYSASERLNYLNVGVKAAEHYPFGMGQGNIAQAIREFGDTRYKMANNAHSLLAECLITAGWFGFALWVLFILYFSGLCFHRCNRSVYGYVPVYLLIASFTSPLLSAKIFWVSLVLLERQLRKNRYREKNTVD